ncbi:unnamed protein product [Schistosoma turkestanicum]|nr:unnamed protein product [Schistosoma turkestanicum]
MSINQPQPLSQSSENFNPPDRNRPVNQWNGEKCRKPLIDLSNTTYTRVQTQSFMNKFDKSLTKKLKTCTTSSSSHSPSPSSRANTDPVNITRRNERERNRVKLLNMGFDRLRAVVPCRSGEQLSKISTLKKAIWYIEHLDKVLHGQENSCSNFIQQSLTPSSSSSSSSSCSRNPSISHVNEMKTCTSHKRKQPIGMTKSAELFENNQKEAKSGTSWSSFEQFMSPHKNISMLERGSVNQFYSAPIFPTYWDTNINTFSYEDRKADDGDGKEHTSASFVHSTPQNRRVDKKNFCPNSNSPSSSSSCLLSPVVLNDSGYHSYQSQYESLLMSSATPTHSTLSTWNNPNHNAGACMLPPTQK